MDEVLLVDRREGTRELGSEHGHLPPGKASAALDRLLEALSPDELHDEGAARGARDDSVDPHDVRVADGGCPARLPFEAFDRLGVALEQLGEELDRDVTSERVLRLVDDPHAAAAEPRDDLEAPQARTGCQVVGHASAPTRFKAFANTGIRRCLDHTLNRFP